MWPFTKTNTDCQSGVLTCDGKHHTWSGWTDILINRTIQRKWMPQPQTFQVNAQERTCVICSYRERRLVDDD